MVKKLLVVGELRPINNGKKDSWPNWLSLNDVVLTSNIMDDLKDTNTSRFKAKLTSPVRFGYEITSIDAMFDPKPWGYQWTGNRWHDTIHALIISVLIPCDTGYQSSLVVAAQFQSDSFRIGCTRRLYGQQEGHLVKATKKASKTKSKVHGYNHRLNPQIPLKKRNLDDDSDSDYDSDSEEEDAIKIRKDKAATQVPNNVQTRAKKHSMLPADVLFLPDLTPYRYDSMSRNEDMICTDDMGAMLTDDSAALLSMNSRIGTFECATMITNDSAAELTDPFAMITTESAAELFSEDAKVLISAAEQLSTSLLPSNDTRTSFINLFESANLILSLNKPHDINFADDLSPHSPRTPRYVSV